MDGWLEGASHDLVFPHCLDVPPWIPSQTDVIQMFLHQLTLRSPFRCLRTLEAWPVVEKWQAHLTPVSCLVQKLQIHLCGQLKTDSTVRADSQTSPCWSELRLSSWLQANTIWVTLQSMTQGEVSSFSGVSKPLPMTNFSSFQAPRGAQPSSRLLLSEVNSLTSPFLHYIHLCNSSNDFS